MHLPLLLLLLLPGLLPSRHLLFSPAAAPAQELKDRHRDVMRELLMDVLRALSAPNLDIRKKTLDIALDLIDARNIDEVRQLLGWQQQGRQGWQEWQLQQCCQLPCCCAAMFVCQPVLCIGGGRVAWRRPADS